MIEQELHDNPQQRLAGHLRASAVTNASLRVRTAGGPKRGIQGAEKRTGIGGGLHEPRAVSCPGEGIQRSSLPYSVQHEDRWSASMQEFTPRYRRPEFLCLDRLQRKSTQKEYGHDAAER
jgi:hypothetical protein